MVASSSSVREEEVATPGSELESWWSAASRSFFGEEEEEELILPDGAMSEVVSISKSSRLSSSCSEDSILCEQERGIYRYIYKNQNIIYHFFFFK